MSAIEGCLLSGVPLYLFSPDSEARRVVVFLVDKDDSFGHLSSCVNSERDTKVTGLGVKGLVDIATTDSLRERQINSPTFPQSSNGGHYEQTRHAKHPKCKVE